MASCQILLRLLLIQLSVVSVVIVYACNSKEKPDDKTDGNNGGCGGEGGINDLLCGDITDSAFSDAGNGADSITRDSDLDCFDWDSGDCLWHNVGSEEDDEDWRLAEGDPDPDQLDKYTGTDEYGDSSAIVAFPNDELSSSERAFLVSNPISCLRSDGSLELKHWISDNAKLKVCVRYLGEIEDEGCQTVSSSDNPGPTTVTIDAVDQPFEIFFAASGFSSDEEFVIIDDVVFQGDVCGSDDTTTDIFGPTSGPTDSPISPIDDSNYCDLLSCNFEPGTECNKAVSGQSWESVKGRCTNNKNTGIRYDGQNDQDGHFACVRGPVNEATILMGDIELAEPKILVFKYFKAAYGDIFEVLLNGDSAFRDDRVTKGHVYWLSNEIQLPAGNNQLEFVASNMENNHFIGLDDLELLTEDGRPFC